ncbi:MAG: ArnT family glycosyltransferase [Fluviicola sp.]
MSYVLLRALFVEPLFDELATLYWYIQTGYLPGRGATMDANNHILNSLVSHQFFRLFGDHFFVYRLFALLTFPIYFFSAQKLLLRVKTPFSILVFLALVSVHWIFDYFSFSRGYGPSLAFLLLAFCCILKWFETRKTRFYIAVVFIFAAALLCNLSLLIPLVILLFYLIFVSIIRVKQFSLKQLAGFWISTLCFMTFLIPVYIYINKLKKAGALWWGSKEGFWEVTGKSISKNVFFSESEVFKYLVISCILLLAIKLVRRWKKSGYKNLLTDPSWWIPLLFVLVLLSIALSSILLEVNYPMDRVGMYLVPLFLLSVGFSIQNTEKLRWSLLVLLWFPVSFVFKMNLDTSVFSPEDRIHHSFYRELLRKIPSDASLSADYVSQASYAYLTRKEKTPHVATDYLAEDSLSRGDYHISWVEKLNWPGYSCILQDPVSGTRLYKNSNPPKKQVILDTIISVVESRNSMIHILDVDLSAFAGKLLQTTVNGKVQPDKYCLDLNLRHEIESRNGAIRRTDNTRFNWYFGRKMAYQFHYPNHPFLVLPEDKVLHIRFYNDDHNTINLSGIHIKILAAIKK